MPLNGHITPAELLAGAGGDGPLVIQRHGRAIYLPSVLRRVLSPEQQRERARLLQGRFFLVNMALGDLGEIFRCGRCNGKHKRLTRYCLDRPFSGLLGGLYGFVQTVKDAEQAGLVNETAQARIDRIRRLFHVTRGLPDLETGHPGLARILTSSATPDPSPATEETPPHPLDLDVGAISLGLLERVEVKDAQKLLDRINLRASAFGAPPLVVPGLRGPE